MTYDSSFTSRDGRSQRIRTIGGSVLIEGAGPGSGDDTGVSCTFVAADFRSASVNSDSGDLSVQVGNDTSKLWFGRDRGVAFTLEDVLEAVAVAKSEG